MSFKKRGSRHSSLSDEIFMFVRPLDTMPTILEEYRLVQIAQSGDRKNADAALTALVRAHSGIVYKLALLCRRQYYGSSLQLHDFVQSGFIGLIHSVRHFDVATGNRLTTYAWKPVLRAMLRELKEAGFLIHIKDSEIRPLAKAIALASSELSLQQIIPGTDRLTFEDAIGDNEDSLEKMHRILMREIVMAIMNRCTFSKSELFIIEHRLMSQIPLTQAQCGVILRMTGSNISAIEKRLLSKLHLAARRLGLKKCPI